MASRTHSSSEPDAPTDRSAPTNEGPAEEVADTTAIVRLSLNIPADTAKVVRESARKRNQSVTDATRRAIAIMAVVDEQLEAGNTLQSVSRDGTVTRFMFL